MVLGLQLYHVLVKFGSVGVLGTAVALSLIREMGPVLTAIMITAWAGSAMTAEIGNRETKCHGRLLCWYNITRPKFFKFVIEIGDNNAKSQTMRT